jgi:hypothetical protein
MKHEPNRRPLFWIFAVTFFVVYCFLKYNSPQLIEDLFKAESFPLLNKLAATTDNQNLAFYQGRIEENVTGPLASVFGGLIFLGFSLVFLKKTGTLTFGLAVFIFLLITKLEVLFFPPWGDHVGGSLEEAVWLARNNFNYIELFHQPGSIYGGPKYFLFSIYPGVVAFLMKVCPTPQIFIMVAHLITFAFAAIMVALLREILLKLFDETTALFTSLFLLALPLYQTMIEMINMDMTSTFFAFLSAYFLIQKRLGFATFLAIVAVWVKGSGAASCGAIFITCLGLFFFSKEFQFKPKLIVYGILVLFMAFLQVYLRSKFVHTVDMHHNSVKFLCGLPHFMGHQYLTHFFFFSLLGIAVLYWKEKVDLAQFFNKHYIALVMFIQALCWFLLHLNVSVMGPRYKLTLAPFLLFSVVYAYAVIFKNKTFIKISLVAAIIISFFSVYGFLEGERVDSHYYAYGPLERSLEYRNDMKLHMKLVKEFQTNFPGFTIGAPHVTAQMLAFPEYGYVKEPLNVLMYGMNITFGGIKNFSGIQDLDLHKTIWIGFRETDPLQFDYPIDAQDKIIKVVNVGDKKATLFMGGIALQKMYMLIILKKMGKLH